MPRMASHVHAPEQNAGAIKPSFIVLHSRNGMKKYVLLVVLGLICLPARGQLIEGFGLKIGLNSSGVRMSGADRTSPIMTNRHRRTGFNVAAFVEWSGFSILYVVTEAGYAQRGFRINFTSDPAINATPNQDHLSFNSNYLSTAALVKLRILRWPLSGYWLLGPKMDVLVSSNDRGTLLEGFAAVSTGVMVGLGFETRDLLREPVFLEVRYHYDVTDNSSQGPVHIYNNALEVLMGVKL